VSRYSIYQINHFDPKIVGQKKRRLALLFGAVYPLFMLTFQICLNFLNINIIVLIITSFPVFLGLYFYMLFKVRSGLKQIKTIGDIEFTRTGIRKRIGDSLAEYKFQSIEKLELQKHIPAISPQNSNSGYFSHILKIVFINSSTELIVVSDKPADKRQNISIVDTMKTLKKIIQMEIVIKS
jgi:hypothetical protein